MIESNTEKVISIRFSIVCDVAAVPTIKVGKSGIVIKQGI